MVINGYKWFKWLSMVINGYKWGYHYINGVVITDLYLVNGCKWRQYTTNSCTVRCTAIPKAA